MTKMDNKGKRLKVRCQVMIPLWIVDEIYKLGENNFNANLVNLLIVGLQKYKGEEA